MNLADLIKLLLNRNRRRRKIGYSGRRSPGRNSVEPGGGEPGQRQPDLHPHHHHHHQASKFVYSNPYETTEGSLRRLGYDNVSVTSSTSSSLLPETPPPLPERRHPWGRRAGTGPPPPPPPPLQQDPIADDDVFGSPLDDQRAVEEAIETFESILTEAGAESDVRGPEDPVLRSGHEEDSAAPFAVAEAAAHPTEVEVDVHHRANSSLRSFRFHTQGSSCNGSVMTGAPPAPGRDSGRLQSPQHRQDFTPPSSALQQLLSSEIFDGTRSRLGNDGSDTSDTDDDDDDVDDLGRSPRRRRRLKSRRRRSYRRHHLASLRLETDNYVRQIKKRRNNLICRIDSTPAERLRRKFGYEIERRLVKVSHTMHRKRAFRQQQQQRRSRANRDDPGAEDSLAATVRDSFRRLYHFLVGKVSSGARRSRPRMMVNNPKKFPRPSKRLRNRKHHRRHRHRFCYKCVTSSFGALFSYVTNPVAARLLASTPPSGLHAGRGREDPSGVDPGMDGGSMGDHRRQQRRRLHRTAVQPSSSSFASAAAGSFLHPPPSNQYSGGESRTPTPKMLLDVKRGTLHWPVYQVGGKKGSGMLISSQSVVPAPPDGSRILRHQPGRENFSLVPAYSICDNHNNSSSKNHNRKDHHHHVRSGHRRQISSVGPLEIKASSVAAETNPSSKGNQSWHHLAGAPLESGGDSGEGNDDANVEYQSAGGGGRKLVGWLQVRDPSNHRKSFLQVVDPSPKGPFRKAPWHHGNFHVIKF